MTLTPVAMFLCLVGEHCVAMDVCEEACTTSLFGNRYAAFCLLNGEERLRIEVNAADSFSDLRLRYVKGMEGAHGRFNVVLPTGTLLDKICMQTPSASVEPWLPRKRGTPSE